MYPARTTWKAPQLCSDCGREVLEGWQELKYSAGGPYLEKRCSPCAEVHYGNALPELVDGISQKKGLSGQNNKTDKQKPEAPLLGLTG